MLFALILSLLLTAAFSAPGTATTTHTVYDGNLTWPAGFALRACVGLRNRRMSASAFLLRDLSVEGTDRTWLRNVYNATELPPLTAPVVFLADCLTMYAGKYIRYNATAQQAMLPSIATLAGVLGAVPLDVGGTHTPLPREATACVFDATITFGTDASNTSALEATRYVFEHHVNETSGLAKLNPGYQSQSGKAIIHPVIVGGPSTELIDYVVYAKLFDLYLPDACLPLTQQHALFKQIAAQNPWPKPLAVMGYDNSFVIQGGDFFEAETLCDIGQGMGQIASAGSANLAYWTTERPHINSPLEKNPDLDTVYNASKTYIAFLIGDGDNVDYIQGGRMRWMNERTAQCDDPKRGCHFPLLWTMSPHILKLSPAYFHWYNAQLLRTKLDRFALPPSGDLYAYPSLFPDDQQDTYVRNTERDAELLSTKVTTAWEWALSWGHALKHYFPKYAKTGIINALVAVNVPYNLPVLAFGNDKFKVMEQAANRSVVFAPHEWRGTRGSKIPFANEENLNVTAMAKEINGYPKGTVTAIYLTSDGGGNLEDINELVNLLNANVVVVGNNIGDMALAASGARPESR
jgi:hypothetical protein